MREGRDKGKKDIESCILFGIIGFGSDRCRLIFGFLPFFFRFFLSLFQFFFRRIDVEVIIQENDNISG